jgi:hypothetical protein
MDDEMMVDQEEQAAEGFSFEEFLAAASPQEVEQLREIARQEEERMLDSVGRFGELVTKMVDEAVEARRSSGIEARWLEDLRQYYGGDWSQMGAAGVVQASINAEEKRAQEPVGGKQRQAKSRIQVNITRPKTNSAISRLSDMLLPTDDRNWGLKPTPNPDLAEDATDTDTVMTQNGQDMQNPDGTPVTKAQVALNALGKARKKCEGMAREIDDQLVECNYNAEFRKGLWDLGVMGTMILRGPTPRTIKKRNWKRGLDPKLAQPKWKLQVDETDVPASERVSPWNFYPDPACGGDIRRSRYTVERKEFNAKTLRDLRGQTNYIDSQIGLCLQEAPQSHKDGHQQRNQRFISGEYEYRPDAIYEVWVVHGEFEKGKLADAGVEGCECADDEDRLNSISGSVFLCNGRVIKAALNPLDSGEIPYDVAVYEKVEGQVFGVGVPFILRNPSRVVIAGWRMVMDNSALSGGIQVVVNKKLVEPADGSWSISGTKVWQAKDGTEDVQKAFQVHQVGSRIPEIMQVIDRALQFAEDESSMPAIMEGSMKQAPEQVGVANMLQNAANTVLRRLVKEVDDNITDPHITRYYDWNMQHNENEEIKGDYQVDARGSSVLLVRDGQRQILMQIGQFVLHPLLGRFHKRSGYDWLKSLYESNHVDSEGILVDDTEVEGILKQMAEEAKRAAESPQDPRIAAAQIKAQVDTQELEIDQQESERDRQHAQIMLDKQLQLEYLRYSNENKVSLEDTRNRMIELMAVQQDKREERALKERLQVREAMIKQREGSGL